MHSMNDLVLYGTEGLCRITDITVRDLYGKNVEYYVLKPMGNGNSTIFVPTGNEALTARMRRILSAEEIYALIRTMDSEETEWIENENVRKQQYREILSEGDRRSIMKMIKAVSLHGEERKRMKSPHRGGLESQMKYTAVSGWTRMICPVFFRSGMCLKQGRR